MEKLMLCRKASAMAKRLASRSLSPFFNASYSFTPASNRSSIELFQCGRPIRRAFKLEVCCSIPVTPVWNWGMKCTSNYQTQHTIASLIIASPGC
jgi:hypothetical protein